MLTLILLLLVGGLMAYISQANLELVSVSAGPYILPDVPLFYVIIGSFIGGLAVAYIFHLVHAIASTWELRGKRKEIRQTKDEVMELTKRVHQLELENQKLKLGHIEESDEPEDPKAL